jgi:hypothetical protein
MSPNSKATVDVTHGRQFSVLRSRFVNPFSVAILHDHMDMSDGLLINALRPIVQLYPTSIVMAAICNVTICFGRQRTVNSMKAFERGSTVV